MTTIEFPGRLMRPVASRPARRATLVGFVATLAIGCLWIVAASAAIAWTTSDAVLPNLSVGGVEISGLSRAAAIERLNDGLPSLATGKATIVVGDERADVAYAGIGRGYETEAMIDAALAIGRRGDVLADGLTRLRSLVHAGDLPVMVHAYDPGAIERISAAMAARFGTPARDARVIRHGIEFTTVPSTAGQRVDADRIRAALAAAVSTTDPADITVEIDPIAVAPSVETADAEAVADAGRATAANLGLTAPGAAADEEPLSLTAETIASWLSFGPDDGPVGYGMHIDQAGITASAQTLATAVARAPVEARIAVAEGGGLGGVIAGQDGRELDVPATESAVRKALQDRANGRSVASLALPITITQPGLTTAEAEAALPQMQMISSWTTYYVPGDGNGYGANINIGAFDIDGRNLYPGEWFSFWDSIGPVTLERGYSYGGAIINGRSTAGVALGGGICSTSTTIFNAALRAGLEMGIRLNHFYYIDRYPDGLDATVSIIGDWTQDMTFRNDTENPIVIRGYGGNGFVTFELWSVPTGRSVVITDPVTSNHRRAGDTTQLDTSLAPGTSKRVEYPHDGHDVTRSRFVYDAAGNQIHANTYSSHYATVDGVTLVGPRPAAPPPSGDPSPSPSPSPSP